MTAIVVALALIVGGGLAALVLSRWPRVGSAFAVLGVVSGAAVGGWEVAYVLAHGAGGALSVAWRVPYGDLRIALDPLSAFFLAPTLALGAIASVYGRAYMLAYAYRHKALGVSWFAFNLLVASMALVVMARQAVLFLVAWEVMSLAAYVLVTFEHEHAEVRRAGWTYLIATHAATAVLIAMFLLLGKRAGSFDFDAMTAAGAPTSGLAALVLVLALVGFGVKAGFVPLHVWLPEAHAAAPSHVSALMSGALIKLGLYGLIRVVLLLGARPPWFGPVLLVIGLAGALIGISLALYQRDMKRVLAYSSIENVGLITVGLGMGLWGAAAGMPRVAMLGTVGALLHVWNHTLMKGLLFLGAGSVLHASGTKDMERLGGLMKRMPRTGLAIVTGAVAISALPPMNGFVSEWLLYLGLAEGALASSPTGGVAVFFGVGLVAFVGALAVLCFVRLVGVALLGAPRSEQAAHAHESPLAMTAPMGILAALAVGVAVVPRVPLAAVAHPVAQLLGPGSLPAADAPVADIGAFDIALWGAIVAVLLVSRLAPRARVVGSDETWGCGYARPTTRMQYTARSFAELMSERLMPGRLRPRVSVAPPTALFAEQVQMSTECSDPLTRGVYEPLLARWGDRFARLRWLQQGMLHIYVAYIVVTALLAVAWASFRTWSGL